MKKLTTALLAMLLTQAYATTYITVDGLHYRIDETTRTATVVCRPHNNADDADDSWMYYYDPSELYVGDIVVPNEFEYNGTAYSVTAIGNSAFAGSKLMTTLQLPSSVVKFGSGTFTLCNALSHITIEAGNPQFFSQDGIMYQYTPFELFFVPRAIGGDITLPDGLTQIPSSTFQRNANISTVTIPTSVTTIKDAAFDLCSNLTEIFFTNNTSSLNTIERNAFSGCTSLTMIDLSVTQTETIGVDAFAGCTELAYLLQSDKLKTIDMRAFENCALLGIELPATLQLIDQYAFRGCKNLATVVNKSALDIQKGAETHGMVAYYATEVIDAHTPTAPTKTEADTPIIATQGRTIRIDGAQGMPIRICSTNGTTIYDGFGSTCQTLTLPNAGLYLVKIGETAKKILVK